MGQCTATSEWTPLSTQLPSHEDRFIRLRTFLGDEGFQRLQRAFVTVIGLGAVGGYATEALTRAGIGRLRLVDFDRIRPSNFNRQILALECNLGKLKTEMAQERIHQINPDCQVEVLNLFVHTDTLNQVLAGPPDLVVDAIDGLNPKVVLLAELSRRRIPVISSMGAALRRDPTLVRVGPLSKTKECPLARRLRKRLRGLDIDLDSILCVHSMEPMDDRAYAAMGDQENDDDTEVRGRLRRPMGSLPTLTGIFGLTCAHAAIQILIHGDSAPLWGGHEDS
jgi:tRNA A37 threonylcarbamoyladenosine dehydratase